MLLLFFSENTLKPLVVGFKNFLSFHLLSVLWNQLIQKAGGVITEALDLSSLAKISDGYTPGHIVKAIQSIVTKRRVLLQAKRPLTAVEFVPPLAKFDPVYQEEEEGLKVQFKKYLWILLPFKSS